MVDPLNSQDKIELQRIIANSSQFQTSDDRSNFLIFSGLGNYCNLIQIDQPLNKFFISLYNKLGKDYIMIDNFKTLALIPFLEYFIQLDLSLSVEDKNFIEYIILRCKNNQQQISNLANSDSNNNRSTNRYYNLPSVSTLVGREKDIQIIQDAFKEYASFVVIEGIGGIGKTVLAISIANQLVKTGQFQQVIWVTAKGRNVNLSILLDEITIALDYPYISSLSLTEKKKEILKCLHSIPCLLVFDNFDTVIDEAKEELFSFLLSILSPSKTLVTTRPPLLGEQLVPLGAYVYKLKGLKQEQSFSLMLKESQRLGIETIKINNQNRLLNELFDITGGSPLAIILAIGQMKYSPYSLETIITNIRQGKGNLFQDIFGISWTFLDNLSRTLLKATTLFASSFTKEAISAAIKNPLNLEFDLALTKLIDFSLIQSNSALTDNELRFDIHPLTRAFAESQLNELLEEKERFNLSLSHYFLDIAKRYEVRFWEGREIYSPLEMERINILASLDWCWDNLHFNLFVDIATAIADFLIVRGHWELCLTYGKKAVEASSKMDNKDLKAWILIHLQGYLYANRCDFDDAKTVLSQALNLYRETQNKVGVSESLRNLARVYRKEGDLTLTRSLYEECYQVALETDNKKLIALAMNEIGKLERDEGDFIKAMELFNSAKTVVEVVDSSIYAGIICNMAGVAVSLGDLENARKYSIDSLQFFSSIDNKEGIATTKWRLAEIESSQNPEKALEFARESYDIFSRLGMKQECYKIQKIISQLVLN